MSELVWKSTSVSRAPNDSSLRHFSVMTRPCWLRRAARNRHRHAIEQASRTRREILISTQVRALVLRALCHVQDVETTQLAALIRARKRPGQRRPPSESNLAGLVQKRRRQEE